MTQLNAAPLTEAEEDMLAGYLDSVPGSLNLEMLDGFFAALACSPTDVPPQEYVPAALGSEHAFKDRKTEGLICDLMERYLNALTGTLKSGKRHSLLVYRYDDEPRYGNDWAAGFVVGMHIGGEAWNELVANTDSNSLLIPVMTLAEEDDPGPDAKAAPLTPDQRDKLLESLEAMLPDIYAYFGNYRS